MIIYKSVAVTGTRKGLSDDQKSWIVRWASTNEIRVFHHGDCIGVDNWVATFFASTGSYIIAHPGSREGGIYRANCKYNNMIMPWSDMLVRNRFMVNHAGLLLAFPETPVEMIRSGTWHTIRYARKQKVDTKIVLPDGTEL